MQFISSSLYFISILLIKLELQIRRLLAKGKDWIDYSELLLIVQQYLITNNRLKGKFYRKIQLVIKQLLKK